MKWMPFLFVVVALAGCSDEPAKENQDPGAVVDPVEAPVWTLGKSLTYSDSQGRTFDLVVAEDGGRNWGLLANDLSVALFDWSPGISFVGTIQKSDLAGQQGSNDVKFFDFPLEHEKTWSTNWDGVRPTMTAIAHPEGFQIEATADGVPFASYTYNTQAGYFGSLVFYNLTDGAEYFSMELVDHSDTFTGSVYRYTAVDEAALVTVAQGGTMDHKFSIEGVTEMIVNTVIECRGGGAGGAGAQEPQEDGSAQPLPPNPVPTGGGPAVYGWFGNCPEMDGEYTEEVPSPQDGEWRIDAIAPGNGEVTIRVEAQTYETIVF